LKARIRREQVDGEWLLERSRLLLKGPKGEIFLTSSETRLLSDLVQAVGQTISREQVALHFNLTCEKTHSASIHVRLSQLRKKLRFAGVKDPSLKSLQKRGLKMCFKLTVQ
jgi:DNA-binding response OmpR family regulator